MISFGREKRLLVGAMALLAPLPLPLNQVLAWPLIVLYLVAVVLFLRRAARDPGSWLPPWAMNVLGALYLPVLYLDMSVFWGGQLVRPVIHLAMFTVVVKLFALRQERDKWHVVGGCFFLFLAAMGTSVHPSVLLYLVVFIALALVVLTRFSFFSVLARFGYREGELARAPLGIFLAGATLAAIAVAVPLFAVLPRIRTPYIMVRGAGSGTIVHAAGFADQITLDSIGAARGSRQVLLRMRFSPQPQPRQEIRLKAATYERYDGRTWRAAGRVDSVVPLRGTFRLGEGAPRQQAEIWLLPWNSASLPMPLSTVAVRVRTLSLGRDRGGAVSLFYAPTSTTRYDVDMQDEPAFDELVDPDPADPNEPTLDARGVTPRIAALARELTSGAADGYTSAVQLENQLSTRYQYTTDFVGRAGQMPLERFLFDERRGHCEFFATAMVMMLRSHGTPARFVTGFLGAEPSSLEGYHIVRQSNAHAWVEAWFPDRGWQVFDPTPAGGRPGALEPDLGLLFGQVWDYLQFRWDRYVLTFGFYDQVAILMKARSVWMGFWRTFRRDGDQAVPDAVTTVEDSSSPAAAAGSGWQDWLPWAVAALTAVALAVAWWSWRRGRRRPDATELYRRLRERLETSGLAIPDSLPPLRLAREAADRFPTAARPTGRVVQLYLRESYAGEALADSDLDAAEAALREVAQALKKAG